MNLDMRVTDIKGVGPKSAEQLQLAGLETVRDLIEFLPRKHEDFSEIVKIADILPGKLTIKATAESVTVKRVRRGMTVTTAVLVDDTGKLNAVWFNQPYRKDQLLKPTKKNAKQPDEFYFSGSFEFNYGRYQLTNPSAEKVSDLPVQTDRLLPIYRSVKGLKSQLVRKILAELRPAITMLPETLPLDLLKKHTLVSRADAYLGMHFPKKSSDIAAAKRRLAFEELLGLLLASELNKQANQQLRAQPIQFKEQVVKELVATLPFALTDDQRRAAWAVLQDMARDIPMNRLLQGDVGAGKTVVAAIAARQAAAAGFQAAIMAPTEILARQHATTLREILAPLGVEVALLTGSTKQKDRKGLLSAIRDGSAHVVVGTHALIQEAVAFNRLGFAVIDEQHRFGVQQRQKLLQKAGIMPHLLAMTATPIPRSLALTVYGDLDITVIREKPADRLPITTKLISPNSRAQAEAAVEKELAVGRQAYVICPLIEPGESEQKSAQEEYDRLRKGVFKHRRIGLLHGKLKPDEKDAVMTQFATHEIDILVSTTVVEVGVDVPNATVMLIETADKFGLSQLHQLRGRVGRAEHQSYCYLILSDSKKPSQRLQEIEKSNDGFYLAERDLQLRGPGEIYGRAQHGELNLQVATLGDTKLTAEAQQAARWCVSNNKLLEYKELAAQVEQYQRLTTLN